LLLEQLQLVLVGAEDVQLVEEQFVSLSTLRRIVLACARFPPASPPTQASHLFASSCAALQVCIHTRLRLF
jgi:hypothetical protein